MSDQTPTTPEVADTSTPAVPDPGTHGDQQHTEINWQKRYEDLRPEFDRTRQQLSQVEQQAQQLQALQQDPDALAAFLSQLGYEIDGGDEPQEFLDPNEQKLSELERETAEMRAWREQQEQQAHLAQLESAVEAEMSELGIPEDAEVLRNMLVSRAVALPATENGRPDIKGAWAELQQLEQHFQQQWAQSKRAPSVPAVGQPGTQAPNLDNPEERIAWMAEQARLRAES